MSDSGSLHSLEYLGYGLDDGNLGFRAGQGFKLRTMVTRCDDSQEIAVLRAAVRVLGLLGSGGSKSRNGYGSFTLKSVETLPSDEESRHRSGISTRERYVDDVRSLLAEFGVGAELPPYTAFSSRCLVAVGAALSSSVDAHFRLAEHYIATVNAAGDLRDRKALGLPRGVDKSRRAKPLLLHVQRVKEGYLPVIAYMPARFRESDTERRPGVLAGTNLAEKMTASFVGKGDTLLSVSE